MDINSFINSVPEDIAHYIKSFVFDYRIEVHSKLHEWSWQAMSIEYERPPFNNAIQTTTQPVNFNDGSRIIFNSLLSFGSRGRTQFVTFF